jgi:hypothetical protein
VRTNFHAFGGEMAKQEKYPEVYLGDPEIDFVMLARSQGVDGMQVREPQALESALRRGADAITAGEPYVLDVRVATMGAGAESTWHQRFKLRGEAGPRRPHPQKDRPKPTVKLTPSSEKPTSARKTAVRSRAKRSPIP